MCNMRASSEGFLPNTRSHVHVIGEARCMFVQLAIRIKKKRKRKEEFGERLGKLSRRQVLGVRLGIVPIFARIIV